MLARILNHIADSVRSQLPAPVILGPIVAGSNSIAGISVKDIFDGFALATPKHRTPARKKWMKRYGNDNWTSGTKMIQPKRNITTCLECGHFHELHTICRNCFQKVNDESQKIIESIRNTWGLGVIDKDVQVLYQGETSQTASTKRIVEQDRPRPMWFAPNLRQKSANPRQEITGPALEVDTRTVQEKPSGDT